MQNAQLHILYAKFKKKLTITQKADNIGENLVEIDTHSQILVKSFIQKVFKPNLFFYSGFQY